MRDGVGGWRQEGEIFVWRYPKDSRHRNEWHFTGDPAGCRSICDLFDRMAGGDACHRTLTLGAVTPAIWAVPNHGKPKGDRFTAMRIVFVPEAGDLAMDADEERLTLNLGKESLPALRAAFADVEVGIGDFGIRASDNRHGEIWMFWWPPRSRGSAK